MARNVILSLFKTNKLLQVQCIQRMPRVYKSSYGKDFPDMTYEDMVGMPEFEIDEESINTGVKKEEAQKSHKRAVPDVPPKDEVYDQTVEKFIGVMQEKGNRKVMRKCIDKTFEHIKYLQIEKYHKAETQEEKDAIELDPKKIFDEAVVNCSPMLITQSARRGGVMYTIPIPTSERMRLFRAFKFIQAAVLEKDKKETRLWDRLSRELIAAANNEGAAVRKKQDLHRKCEDNKQYANYRW